MQQESHVARQDKFVTRQRLLTYLVFQLVVRHQLNACDISSSTCDKVRLSDYDVKIIFLYHILNIAKTGTFQYIQSEGTL